MIYIGVLGYGTVGSGVVEVLDRNKQTIRKHVGEEVCVKNVLDLRDFPNDPIQEKIVHDYDIILNDPEIRIIVEVMGGVEPAYTFVKKALSIGKAVVTSNKALVAEHGAELLEIAKNNHTNFLFEASVGGGIPIIRPLYSSLTADVIEEITGILNGTTNYILTKMFDEGAQFEDVLSQAQALGYAERDPSADVDGFDAARKIAILTSLVGKNFVDFKDLYVEGIRNISADDILYAKKMGLAIKLLAGSRATEDGNFFVFVAPFMIDKENPLYNVRDVFNAVCVKSNMLGETMYYGKGAGKLPTASAVVGDVIDAARHMFVHIRMNLPLETAKPESFDKFESSFMVRMKKEQAEAFVAKYPLAGLVDAGVNGELAVITECMSQSDFAEIIKSYEVINQIRILNS